MNIILLLAVKFVGYEANGAKRWLNLGFMRFQPSELTKLILIIFFAYFFTKYKDQLNTWNEQSFMLFPTADSQFVLGLWQAEDMVGDNFDIYEFDGNHAELIAKDLPSWGDIHLTENGAFTAEYSQWDWNQPYQDINSASYREYSTIYYHSGEEKEELLQLDSSSVQMAYLPASRKLWLRAREESAEYPQELWITYLYDLDSSELRKVNEESFNIYE